MAAGDLLWKPFLGGQQLFLSCPFKEALAEGNRGGGKTETLLIDFARDVGMGFGPRWRGVLFRREYKQLDDVVAKAKQLFLRMQNRPKWLSSKSDYKFVWPTGEELLLRMIRDPDEYWNYHGQEFPWQGWEELTTWPDARCYDMMASTNRCAHPKVHSRRRATTNPFGAGHGWVKHRFIDPMPRNTPIRGEDGEFRIAIHMDLIDNKALMAADPNYIQRLENLDNEQLKQAWRYGNWDIAVGGFLAGVWDGDKHAVKPFSIPHDWRRWRAGDWGFSNPYSIGWYAMSPEGCIYRYRELYGMGEEPPNGSREPVKKVAERILQCEAQEAAQGIVFRNNPMDSAIWNNDGQEKTVGELFGSNGVKWTPAKKGPGSRISGAQVVIQMLSDNQFKVFDTCHHWLRTVPTLMPDENNWEDVDTDQEDHAWDETRYSLVSRHKPKRAGGVVQKPLPGTFDYLTRPEPVQRSIYRLGDE